MTARRMPTRFFTLRRVLLIMVAVGLGVLIAVGGRALGVLRSAGETTRTTAEFDPPVWAGQDVPWACSGGFYARDDQTIVITITPHCAKPGTTLRDFGAFVGTYGPLAQLTDCPAGRFCAPSDFLPLALASDRIPWGHLNLVDLGAGGYHTIEPGTRALACADINLGDHAETNAREHYRTGPVLHIGPYEYETDTMFPCMIVTDIEVAVGDSGGAVLVDGLPAGIVSRAIGDRLAFTPLAEGLENLGLTLCTTPSCDLSPETAEQPTG